MVLRPRAGGSTETSGAIVEGEVFGEGLSFGEGLFFGEEGDVDAEEEGDVDVEEGGAGSEAEGASLDDGSPTAAGLDGTSVTGGGRGVSRK
jgi:hypothetical protein